MISKIKNGLTFFIDAWKIIDYKRTIAWGVLSSIYTGIFLLSINYISEKLPDPFIGYILRSILSLLIIVPIFLVAYIMVDKKSISKFKNHIAGFYMWLLPSIIISCLAGVLMIFIGNIYILYSLILLNAIYLVITMFSPYYLLKHKDLKESIVISMKKICSNIDVLIPVILNILTVIIIFYAVGYLPSFIAKYNMNMALILTIIFSLFKPLLYALPLFNMLTIVKNIKDDDKTKKVNIDKVGDVI